MTQPSTAPADTAMMVIVHDALRRDLRRATEALSNPVHPDEARRRAIAEHLLWLMEFLHAHHHGEDAGLWPLVRERSADATPILDQMESDHARIAPMVDDVAGAAARYRHDASGEPREALVAALDSLHQVLGEHLRREEDEMLPVVSQALSQAEWDAVDQEYFVKHKSMRELGIEGHWLLDGLDASRAEVVVRQVPPVPRFILLHGFARAYRRRAIACWGDDPTASREGRRVFGPEAPPKRTIPRTGGAVVTVNAPVDAVWQVVTDVTRVGEWSHECHRAEWIDGATGPEPGARFKGTNKAGPWTWSRTNEILTVDEPRVFAWQTVPTLVFPDSSIWRMTLEPVEGRTQIVQEYEVVRLPSLLARVLAFLVPAHRDRSAGLEADLRRIGELAASERKEQAPRAALKSP